MPHRMWTRIGLDQGIVYWAQLEPGSPIGKFRGYFLTYREVQRISAVSQSYSARTLSCARRRSGVTRCNGSGMPPYGLLSSTTTSSVQPTVRHVSPRRQTDRQTDRQTNTFITILRSLPEMRSTQSDLHIPDRLVFHQPLSARTGWRFAS